MERIGEFSVMTFHNVRNGPALHSHFKSSQIDAAVIDAAYIVSHLHLAAALHRLASSPLVFEPHAAGPSAEAGTTLLPQREQQARREPERQTAVPTARDVFASLSHTRNLDRVMERLTCGSTTTAVVIVQHAPSSSQLQAVAEFVEGEQHSLSELGLYYSEAAVRDFYGIGEGELNLEAAVVNRLSTSII
ncbi:unnamed protein product [Trypanosoma congolense IL3000]|uniref:WGS project CAEQ00000000 data, annotated contig 1743 n=1 Tax=Trypanosoma congolense (strain IL3000) TaxID=1068625 RepID=F9W8L0_TRYCI|nr:unnamed protein product [Trypanosoma congolense IL3000]